MLDWYIRQGTQEDHAALFALFKATVHRVNARDYNAEQINAWVPADEAFHARRWARRFAEGETLIIEDDLGIAGFLIREGTLIDMLYVRHDCQQRGIAKALMHEAERRMRREGQVEMCADVSITARPFFERQGFVSRARQYPTMRGVEMVNFKMEKDLRCN